MNTINQTARRGHKSASSSSSSVAPDAPKQPDTKTADEGALTEDQVSKMIGKSITDTFAAEMPKHLTGMITEDKIKAIIAAEFKKMSKDSTTISAGDIKTLTENSIKAQMDTLRRDKKAFQDPDDANQDKDDGAKSDRSRIEMPLSYTKGNLPLHAKQLLNLCMHKNANDGVPESMLVKGKALGDQMLNRLIHQAKACQQGYGKSLTSTGAGTGDEFVPTDLSAQLLRQFFLASNLAAVFAAKEVEMPTDPFVYPLSTTRPQFYNETVENTAATASDPATSNTTLQTVRLVGQTNFSYELDEDSIIAILPMLQMLLAEGAADAWEDVLINGDTTGTHQDSDTASGSAKLPAKAFKGFRKLSLAVSGLKTDISSAGAGANSSYLAVRKLLKKYGGDPRKLIWVASPTTGIAMQGVAEVVSIEKFGSRATIVTGEIAALQGIPIIQSERVREDVNASGVYDASVTTKATVHCINLDRFITGYRRQLMVEVWKDIQSGKNVVVASMRKAFTPIQTPSTTITSCAIGYNFTP
jgi:HK97 family phage major capsid protein